VELSPALREYDAIERYLLRTRVHSCWGDLSLVQAQLDCVAEVLRRCPRVQHIALVSGHDVPVALLRCVLRTR
jgi:Core-2/I-Branching enzyme